MKLKIEAIEIAGFEKVVCAGDSSVGLNAIIAIHSTRLGPACGGVRLLPYSSKADALQDVLRLAKGMSYKSAVAGLDFGGGKSVIIADPSEKSPALFRRFGEAVESLEGAYIAAKDMNIASVDLVEIKRSTSHVLGIDGVEGSSGDPSPVTAIGCFEGLRAAWHELSGGDSLVGVCVAIQGLGHVGFDLARRIVAAGGRLVVSDINRAVVERARAELNAQVCANDQIFDVECNVFAPCARGGVLNSSTIERLKCQAVVGCANNQLQERDDGFRLWERNILYAPDFVVNAGGIINVFVEYEGYDRARAMERARKIGTTLKEILVRSRREKCPPFLIADRMAEERLHA